MEASEVKKGLTFASRQTYYLALSHAYTCISVLVGFARHKRAPINKSSGK
jgi:hypothetical protein